MSDVIGRPAAKFGPGAGLYRNDLFQIAYVTNDIERALKVFADRYGVKVLNETNVPGFLQARIVEAPDLGHWIEYIFPVAGGVAYFQGVPSN